MYKEAQLESQLQAKTLHVYNPVGSPLIFKILMENKNDSYTALASKVEKWTYAHGVVRLSRLSLTCG